MQDEISFLYSELKRKDESLKEYKKEIEFMSENIRLLKKALYGQSSERVEDLPDQYKLFNEAELEEVLSPRPEIKISYIRKKG